MHGNDTVGERGERENRGTWLHRCGGDNIFHLLGAVPCSAALVRASSLDVPRHKRMAVPTRWQPLLLQHHRKSYLVQRDEREIPQRF